MYLNITTNQYPVSEQDIRSAFLNTSFSVSFQPPEDYVFVFASPQPAHDTVTEYAREIAPILNDKGTWEQQWEVVKIYNNQEDEAAAIIAAQEVRNNSIKNNIIQQTQYRLDQFAQTRNYDNILSACTYATSPTAKFATEGQYCVNVRDATWAKLLEILSDVENNLRPIPGSYSEIESELPSLVWPL